MVSIKEVQPNTATEEGFLKNSRSHKRGRNKLVLCLLLLLVVLGFLYIKQHRELSRLKDPVLQTEYAQKQIEKIISDMKKSVVIPEDEQLKLLGIIDNAEKLKKDQPFYTDVENGDYVFLFSKTARALIWRPQDKKVINFGVADVQQTNTQQQSISQATPKEVGTKETEKEDKSTNN